MTSPLSFCPILFRLPLDRSCRRVLELLARKRRRLPLYIDAADAVSCRCDVAPNFYPAAIGVWRSVMPSWAVMAAVREAEPSVERSAADRHAARVARLPAISKYLP
jgi:hypothetical protein